MELPSHWMLPYDFQWGFCYRIEFQNLSLSEAVDLAKKENKKVFIHIGPKDNTTSQFMYDNIYSLAEVGEYYNQHFICLKVDEGSEEGKLIDYNFNTKYEPTMLFLTPDHYIVLKKIGSKKTEVVLKWGKFAANYEKSKFYWAEQAYKEGDRTKEVLYYYTFSLKSKDYNYIGPLREYQEAVPNLDLTDDKDFRIFCMLKHQPTDPKAKEFIANIESVNPKFRRLAGNKVVDLIFLQIDLAVEQKDFSLFEKALETMYPAYEATITNGKSKAELLEMAKGRYESSVK